MTQREELKPCPFCGSVTADGMGYNYHKVCCSNLTCHLSNVHFTKNEWNARAKARAVQQWTPVSERLPDEGVLCIVFGVNGVVNNHFEYYKPTHIQGYFDSVIDGCVLELDEVTHWMPLPVAPEQNK